MSVIPNPDQKASIDRSQSPRRTLTDPEAAENPRWTSRIKKRIIVCCDGTWQDGIIVEQRWKYTNILRLARMFNHQDERFQPPIPQIVFYQSGIGSAKNWYAELVEGDKVQEAYAFIAHNYQPGDEIFLFGFSRGAYTARMVASLIGEIGVLDRTDMDVFADLFIAYQKRSKSQDDKEKAECDRILAPWIQKDSPGKRRADSDQDTFSIKSVGVFDTVGSVGLPEELTIHSKEVKKLYGFSDAKLGEHIERAYQALALNETRADFNCSKFEQTEGGRRKKQILKQCWFTGSHSDIGGGFKEHDLSDLTLTWMAANIGDMVSLDPNYLSSLPDPVAPWGQQRPHNPTTGIFMLADTIQRQYPTSTNEVTHEHIHPSVLEQKSLLPALRADIEQHPELIAELMPLEEEMRQNWPYHFDKHSAPVQAAATVSPKSGIIGELLEKGTKLGIEQLKKFSEDSSMAAVGKEILNHLQH
ncbi:hypothetical protein GLOTRDRAFT_118837 [Gloeophyllum trabeum ATCC 11539]|uniref:T6SS Phospholipase effector Tle1-like catalytic domain-containing protein n=1 Tax=Gloeophyllum trabeum (strain ATCC 11539 / FP-39264 / Madison 617) TaxID=670483 RepID=S7QM90_GLOTA|nr:uncharacterized protein GLOTRDRAFT_118837 [Gloeophyllum trabeum ATCC 11539]EPQ60681.1 hypothetical protein GLOTRDRAFT_118837 [Gloeophyllum trabeum ATCC 11539]